MQIEHTHPLWWAVLLTAFLVVSWCLRVLPDTRWFRRLTRMYHARKAIAAALTSTCRLTTAREVVTDNWHDCELNFWVLNSNLSISACGTYHWNKSIEVVDIRHSHDESDPNAVAKYRCHRPKGVTGFTTVPLP